MAHPRVLLGTLFAAFIAFFGIDGHAGEPRHITIAAAADLRFALDAVIVDYRQAHPQDVIEVTYGSSGKLLTQIEQGAPFELFFSADSDYPKALVAADASGGTPVPYAMGSIVLWSASVDASKLTLADLTKPEFDHIAIANPQHAPYGKRAEQALRAAGVWDAVQSKLTYGDNIAQTAQFVASGNAKIGIIARSLALDPQMAAKGKYAVIPTSLYAPLVQSFVLTKRGANNALATDFVQYVQSAPARDVLRRYGFSLPDAPASH
jgi:molybdate transport system substrate-binding protein